MSAHSRRWRTGRPPKPIAARAAIGFELNPMQEGANPTLKMADLLS